MKFKHLFLIIIFASAVLVRFYNYPDRITFGPEQAISLITSGKMITEKFSLLGAKNVQRVTSSGHSLFSGAIFSYSLIPLQLLFSYNAYPITLYFTLLNLFTALVVYLVTVKIFNDITAYFAVILFLFSSVSVYHSLFVWDQNYAFLLGSLMVYFIYLLKRKEKASYIMALGLMSGLSYSIQDLYAFVLLLVFWISLKVTKHRLRTTFYFIASVAFANLSTIIFDIRHGFYYLNTNIEYFKDVIFVRGNNASLMYYHFLILLPLVFILGGFILERIFIKDKMLSVLAVFLYIYINLSSSWVNFNAPTGMPSELTLANINKASKLIADDNPENFNVAVLVDYDTRGHILRYPLEFMYKIKPMDVVEYPNSQNLYVYAKNNYDFADSKVWELSSFDKQNVEKLVSVSENYSVFKLVK